MSLKYAQIRGRLFDRPLMITESGLENVVALIGPRIGGAEFVRMDGSVARYPRLDDDGEIKEPPVQPGAIVYPDDGYCGRSDTPYDISPAGIAVIPVHGTIVQRHWRLNAACGLTSTEALVATYEEAARDSRVRGVYLDMDTPGGEVAGTFDAVDSMVEIKKRSGKPLHAHANEMACSAGYAIASVADHFSGPRTAYSASVGVIALHADVREMYEGVGIKVSVIRCAEEKALGGPFDAMEGRTREVWEADIRAMYEIFVETVVRNRAGLTEEAVRGSKSAALLSAGAVSLGFMDAIMSQEAAAAHLLSVLD